MERRRPSVSTCSRQSTQHAAHILFTMTMNGSQIISETLEQRNSVNLNSQNESIPDSPGVHSDVVSLGSRAGPAPLPAHSSVSERAAPIFASDTHCFCNFLCHLCVLNIDRNILNLIFNCSRPARSSLTAMWVVTCLLALLVQITACQPTSVALPWLSACSVKLQLLWMCSFP